jgi:hypothetical protein
VPHRIVNQVPHRPVQFVGINHDQHRLVGDGCYWDSSSCVRPGHLGNKIASIDLCQPCRWLGVGVGTCQQQQVLDERRQPFDVRHEVAG